MTDTAGNAQTTLVGSPQSVTVTRNGEPDAPVISSVTAGNAQVAVAWSAPANNGAAVSDYVVQYSTSSGGSYTTFTDGTSTSTTATVTGLTNSTAYYFKVAAINSVGTGSNSAASAAATPTLPTQTVTWSPTTALTTTQSPNTPLAASSSGDGAITYAVQSAGATGCTINSSTRVLTFTTAGNCVVRATAATTSNYLTGYIDVTFTVTLAAPAFTLSSSSESKAQNTAITGYTISSTGGTIASYAISPSAPTGLSFNTSTGLLSGTPTTVRTATGYTITATNATGMATQTFTFTVTVAAPAFTLSSGSESKAQNVAITGYTISSTGGTVASYAISPSAPTGLSFSTSTGLLSGTPTTVRTATGYTITATNATGTATQTFTLTVTAATCANGGVCIVGNTGPGGGIVFYVASTNFTSTGSDCGTACKYLEAATSDRSTGIEWATTARFCYNSGGTTDTNNCQKTSIYSGDDTAQAASRTAATAIGKGMANTNQVHLRLTIYGGALTSTYAAGIAYAYANSGKTDWHLPSKDELNQLYINRATVGGFSTGYYQSSSEYDVDTVWWQGFADGDQFMFFKEWTIYVRPVRAFG